MERPAFGWTFPMTPPQGLVQEGRGLFCKPGSFKPVGAAFATRPADPIGRGMLIRIAISGFSDSHVDRDTPPAPYLAKSEDPSKRRSLATLADGGRRPRDQGPPLTRAPHQQVFAN